MKRLSEFVPDVVKKLFPADKFYPLYLEGSFGRQHKDGWVAWNGLCPFHADTRAGSFFINRNTGGFNCFSCGASGGDIFDFHMQKEGVPFITSLNTLGGYVSCNR